MESGLMSRGDLRFILSTIVLVLLAHATAYFAHELSHATTAWLLGWMRSPVAISYGRLTLSNVLLQQEVGDGVDYAPIFRSGHGFEAALIAFDGPGIGNGALYVLCFVVLRKTRIVGRPWLAGFVFWLAVMGAGNVWSYAPIRTVTTHADMALVARGLAISTWALLPFVTVPSLLIQWSFFARLLPFARRSLFARGPTVDSFAVVLACSLLFEFFGFAGIDGRYGEVSACLSILSLFVLFPLVTTCLLNFPGGGPTLGNPSDRL